MSGDAGTAGRELQTAGPNPSIDTIESRVDVGGLSVSIVRPRDPERLIDEAAFARDEFLPYWAELWPSAVALARLLSSRQLTGVRALELGCGLGLASIAAAHAGADVVATDWSEDALSFARANAQRNSVPLATELLRWDESTSSIQATDLVFAADVLYEERNGSALLELLPLVAAPGGEVVLADPGRRHAPAFLHLAAERWRVETTTDPLLPRGGFHRLWID